MLNIFAFFHGSAAMKAMSKTARGYAGPRGSDLSQRPAILP
jgi:hypothetical protein